MATPDYMKSSSQPTPPVQTTEAPIPLSSVRLVTPVVDPYTGFKRDVIVNEIMLSAKYRYIANYTDPTTRELHRIPWPPEEKPEFQDNDDDTLRIDVERETWVPTLLRAPMPSGVIDELRNKYSKFRTRHEDSYIEMQEEKDRRTREKEEELKWGGGTPRAMLTPVQELNRKRRMEKLEGEGEDGLTEEVLAGIGQVMARRGMELPEEKVKRQEADVLIKHQENLKKQEADRMRKHQEKLRRQEADSVAWQQRNAHLTPDMEEWNVVRRICYKPEPWRW